MSDELPWSAGPCHRFVTSARYFTGLLLQSGDKAPHSKEVRRTFRYSAFNALNNGVRIETQVAATDAKRPETSTASNNNPSERLNG